MSSIRAISSYRLAGLICELDSSEMKQIDAALAQHLDLMRHYNTLLKSAEDKEKHVDALNNVLRKLRYMTNSESNQELVEAVGRLISGNNSS